MQEEKKSMEIEQPHSVEFSVNAKGQWSSKVKCYGCTPDDAFAQAYSLAVKAESLIKAKNG